MSLNLSECSEANMLQKDATSPSKDAAPQSSMDEWLQMMQAELNHLQKLRHDQREQWQDDNIGLTEWVKQMAQQLAEGETAHQEGVQEWTCIKDTNVKLELCSFKTILSTLKGTSVNNLSAHIAEDPAAGKDEEVSLGGDESEGEGENGPEELQEPEVDPYPLGPDNVLYTAQDVCDREQEWQEAYQNDLLHVQQ